MDLASQVSRLDQLMLSGVTAEFPAALTDDERVATSAYLILSHACVEDYVEELFLRYYDRLVQLSVLPVAPRAVAHLTLAVGMLLPEKSRVVYSKRSLHETAQAGRSHFLRSYIQQNNGVKAANVKKLAEGVGLDWTEFEVDLAESLDDLETLGAKRGEAGHLSPFSLKRLSVTLLAYPDDVRGWVEAGVNSVAAVETYLEGQASVPFLTLPPAE